MNRIFACHLPSRTHDSAADLSGHLRVLRPGVVGLLLLAVVAAVACDEDAATGPREAPPDAGGIDANLAMDAGSNARDGAADADEWPPFDGSCGGETCMASNLATPGCCTRPGTGVAGNPLENAGRGPGLCGTEIGALIPSLTGTCVQLSQPGWKQDECPPQVPLAGGPARHGCCTDEGFCGSYDELVPLGCFYATGRKGRQCDPRMSDGPNQDADGGSP